MELLRAILGTVLAASIVSALVDGSLPDIPAEPWISNAILDVAYFLRRFKFHGRDERYPNHLMEFHKQFPEPPLKNLHWQVRQHCETNFEDCLKFTWDRINEAQFMLTRQSNPFQNEIADNVEAIKLNQTCSDFLQADENNLKIFRSRLERFQWLTTTAYFLCWYTLKKTPALQHFGERCDNFALCLNKKGQFGNGDIRASDETPFSCAFHSFCPDPCCANRELVIGEECPQSETACSEGTDGGCAVEFDGNLDWESMTRNYWNVTCTCQRHGLRWSSSSGLCIDIDECFEDLHTCDRETQRCINVLGSYHCVCTFGYTPNHHGHCEKDKFLESILYHDSEEEEYKDEDWFDKYKKWANTFRT